MHSSFAKTHFFTLTLGETFYKKSLLKMSRKT